jgi:hypothetical protein
MQTLRDRMLDAPDEIDEARLPPRFREARALLRESIARAEAAGVLPETIVTVLMSEMMPRMVETYGPIWVAAMLTKLAANIRAGVAPGRATQ